MAAVAKFIKDFYDLIINTKVSRTETLPLVQPTEVITIVAIYLAFTCKWGPNLMKNRQPFKIDKIILVYNALQVVACAYVFIKAGLKFMQTYKLFCQPPERLNTPEAWDNILLTYFYFLLKVADLFDTVFFVLRKKIDHVSFLHLYHHAGMVLLIAGAVNYVPAGHGSSIGIINCFVHCIMYSYYFLTLYKPDYKKNIWWKKYITQLQIVQFLLFVVHFGSILFISNCEYPKFAVFLLLPQNIFMLLMFVDFYYKEYVKKRPQPTNHIMKNEHEDDIKLK